MMNEDEVEIHEQAAERSRCCGWFHCCGSICSLLCCPPCPGAITAKMAFAPPSPPTYDIREEANRLVLYATDPFKPEDTRLRPFTPPIPMHIVRDVRTCRNKVLCGYFLENPQATHTLLYSHGNAVPRVHSSDLTHATLGISIFAYDYAGYGCSSGRPSEVNLYADVRAAMSVLTERFGIPRSSIIIYGQSIGTVPSVDLAAKSPDVAGLILHSPLASGLRVLKPSLRRTYCCDPFPSIEKIDQVTVPTLIIHGKEDEVIAFSHAVALHHRCGASQEPLWVDGAGHNDIEMYSSYLDRLELFINNLRINQSTS